ncbi:hypothetical protein F4678DRAFT_169245 [Xylaria arbuscula]|nr:hypothetical protein F4678DRAFT_169245 [Xylaria arbuscula]
MSRLGKPSRQFTKLCRSRLIAPRPVAPISKAPRCRYSSSASHVSQTSTPGIGIEAIRASMLARPPQIHMDMMYSTPSYTLDGVLKDFLPLDCIMKQHVPEAEALQHFVYGLPDSDLTPLLPAGHHFIYFPLRLPSSQLCADGTDPFHSPRHTPFTPFTRRMWAGGSIRNIGLMGLDRRLAVCLERIVDVKARGVAGNEKIFVEVQREYVTERVFAEYFDPGEQVLKQRALGSPSGITERRTLVFMREPSEEEKMKSLEGKQKVIKSTKQPDYSVTLTPTPTLLFQYSALTFNAHRIHLDRAYCREVEGYRDLLVHGPLSLTMMLSVLNSLLDESQREFIDSIEYQHLAPLYVGQSMRICVARRKPPAGSADKSSDDKGEQESSGSALFSAHKPAMSKWDVWVENQDGGLCVKATIETVNARTTNLANYLDVVI